MNDSVACAGEKDLQAAASAPVTPPVGHTDGAGR
jgi:hypothetical protein